MAVAGGSGDRRRVAGGPEFKIGVVRARSGG